MPMYDYQHPETGEMFEVLRPIKDRAKPYIAPDGVKCPRMPFARNKAPAGWRLGREGWEVDADYYKHLNPKYVRYQDGRKERYHSGKHTRGRR